LRKKRKRAHLSNHELRLQFRNGRKKGAGEKRPRLITTLFEQREKRKSICMLAGGKISTVVGFKGRKGG